MLGRIIQTLSTLLTAVLIISKAFPGSLLCPHPSTRTDTYVPISGVLTFCDLPCGTDGDYNVDHYKSMVFTYYCQDRSLHVYGGYKNRTTVDETCGCVNVSDVRDDDAGKYFIYFTDKNEKKILQRTVDCYMMVPIIISNISMTITGETSSLTVFFTGDEPASVIWSKIGRKLPEGYLLTDQGKTLSIPGAVTGVYRVVVRNAASEDTQEYSVPGKDRGHYKIIGSACLVLVLIVLLIWLKKSEEREKKKEERSKDII